MGTDVRRQRPSRPRGVWRLTLGVTLVVAATTLFLLRAAVLIAAHPAHAATLGVLAFVGVVLLVLGIRDLRSSRPLRARRFVVVGRTATGLLVAVVIGAMVYLIPFSASAGALAAVGGSPEVRVTSSPTSITLTPTSGPADAGLVFQPGARVDPRAYLPLLERVSAGGYLVVIVKQPFEIGFTAIGAPGAVISAHPEIRRWAVGGHSLGGVAASSYAEAHAGQVSGLLLWASYPLGSLAARTDLAVTSVSGTSDGLATPADIEASRSTLPAATRFVAIEGGVHAYFGDYGAQPGDGTPGVDRATAQTQVVAASTTLLGALATRP
ncbi:MAG: alpha/beta hydrolase [Lapillicoccus sp.]